jgi:hypothetical protein
MARQFQHVDVAHQVGADIGLRIDQRVADAGLRAQVDDTVERVTGGEIVERRLIGEIDLFEREGIVMT